MKLRLTCTEGFSYISWQRIICEVEINKDHYRNVAKYICDLVNDNTVDDPGSRLYYAANSEEQIIFVQSGESFTLGDFAEALQSMLTEEDVDGPFKGIAVEFKNGDDEVQQC